VDTLTELNLFSGYGGFNLGLRLAGIPTRTVCYVEWDRYCQQVIQARIEDRHLDDAPIWDDIKSFDGIPWRGTVDILTAGFPCQPHSNAGLRKGEDDDRNLWPDTLRIIGEVGPGIVILENVPGILVGSDGRPPYGGTVVGELAEVGYDAEWRVVSAADAGAPHLRNRWWLLSHANGSSRESSNR
jgi:DNA (cytosine-5)-methyltransferase 1